MAGWGFWLYKMNHQDGIWIHQHVAPRFLATTEGLRFPVDEWACYMDFFTIDVFRFNNEWTSYMREWMLHENIYTVLFRIWSNLSSLVGSVGLPFTLDLATKYRIYGT